MSEGRTCMWVWALVCVGVSLSVSEGAKEGCMSARKGMRM